MDFTEIFNLVPFKDLYEILEKSNLQEREILCKQKEFVNLCNLLKFDEEVRNSKDVPGFVQYSSNSLLLVLQGFNDFSTSIDFINAVRPGFVYSDEFKEFVKNYVTVEKGEDIISYVLGDQIYDVEFFPETTNKKFEAWYFKNKLDKKNGPAKIEYLMDGSVINSWYRKGKLQFLEKLHPDGTKDYVTKMIDGTPVTYYF